MSVPVQGQLSFMAPFGWAFSTVAGQYGNGSVVVWPIDGEIPFSASAANFFASVTQSTTTNSLAGAISAYIGLYTLNASTLSLASSGSQSYQFTYSSTNSTANIIGFKMFTLPINVNFSGGQDVWLAFMTRTSSTGAASFAASNIVVSGQAATQSGFGMFGVATQLTLQVLLGAGMWSTTSTALPTSILFTAITGPNGTNPTGRFPPMIQFYNLTV
jgi:hypothetical protein